MSKAAKIGFIGGFPIPDIVGPANALLLGAQSVNPATTCNVVFLNSWYDPGKEKEAALALLSQGCDVICGMTDTGDLRAGGRREGRLVDRLRQRHQQVRAGNHLTAFMMDWTRDYLRAAKTVADGTWKSEVRWDGLAAAWSSSRPSTRPSRPTCKPS